MFAVDFSVEKLFVFKINTWERDY